MLGTLRSMRRAHLAVYVFVAWTEIVWIGRIRNVMATDGWTARDLLLPLLFVALGLGVVAVIVAPTPPWVFAAAVRGAAAVSVGVWLVRLGFIVVHDHPGAFKAVHVVLAAVSAGLAAWAVRASSPVDAGRDATATI